MLPMPKYKNHMRVGLACSKERHGLTNNPDSFLKFMIFEGLLNKIVKNKLFPTGLPL